MSESPDFLLTRKKRQRIADSTSSEEPVAVVKLTAEGLTPVECTQSHPEIQRPKSRKVQLKTSTQTILYKNPFPEQVIRTNLDFDIEKICSVTLQNVNVHACLTCGVFFQGIQPQSPAYLHSLQQEHFMYFHLTDGTFWYLPDGLHVIDPSLDDIYENLYPSLVYRRSTPAMDDAERATQQQSITTETSYPALSRSDDANPSIPLFPTTNNYIYKALDGSRYIPCLKGITNIGRTEWLSCCLVLLSQVHPLRDQLLSMEVRPAQALEKYKDRLSKLNEYHHTSNQSHSLYSHDTFLQPIRTQNALVLSLALAMKHMAHYASFRAQISPFDFLHTVSTLSNHRFQAIKQQHIQTQQLTQKQLDSGGSGRESASMTQNLLAQQQQIQQTQPQQFLLWLLHQLHEGFHFGGKENDDSRPNKNSTPTPTPPNNTDKSTHLKARRPAPARMKQSSSPISELFQGQVQITTREEKTVADSLQNTAMVDGNDTNDQYITTKKTIPFFCLTLTPVQSVFHDPHDGNTGVNTAVAMHNQRNANRHKIDQLTTLLNRYNGVFMPTTTTSTSSGKKIEQSMRLKRLPPYLLLNINRFFKNDFVLERDSTLIEIDPSGTIDLGPYMDPTTLSMNNNTKQSTLYDLVANIVHTSTSGDATSQTDPSSSITANDSSYKIYVYHDLSTKWYCCRDLSISTTPNTFKEALTSRSVALLFRRKQ